VSAPLDLRAAAHQEMLREGFEPDFPPEVVREVGAIPGAAPVPAAGLRDLRGLLWSSIDNPESRDLDQVEYVERLPGGDLKVLVAIADVDALVAAGSATDRHAAHNTTSVYCGVTMFPMLPERLSTGLTSLNEHADREAVVIEFVVARDGATGAPDVYRAAIRNAAQLDYPGVAGWLEATGPAPAKVAASAELAAQLKLQDGAAQALRGRRHLAGALDLETIEATPVASDGRVTDLALHRKNRATDLIEDFMIAANVTMATFLAQNGSASIRRVVRVPERWDRIVTLAGNLGEKLPATPSSEALGQFLSRRHQADPDHFPDLSLSVVKLMGPGVYALEQPGQPSEGHFGLAVQDYSHSTAPNRRYADLVTQRLLKACLGGGRPAYSSDELAGIATRCTAMEDAARKVERTTRKQAAAELLADRIGQSFDAIVTGKSPKGTFVRTLKPHAEGMVVRGQKGMDVGDRVTVRLVETNPARGFIDFAR
jgi:VacB/RNase II family 3'-5' exoribonuclease